jgi:hypothetical protein
MGHVTALGDSQTMVAAEVWQAVEFCVTLRRKLFLRCGIGGFSGAAPKIRWLDKL